MLDKELTAQQLKKMPFWDFIGGEVISMEEGEVILGVRNQANIQQNLGYIHGGVLATLADTCAGLVALSVLPDVKAVVTSEFKIHYLRPATSEAVHAVGNVLKRGKRQTIVEIELKDPASDKLLAKFIGTMVPA